MAYQKYIFEEKLLNLVKQDPETVQLWPTDTDLSLDTPADIQQTECVFQNLLKKTCLIAEFYGNKNQKYTYAIKYSFYKKPFENTLAKVIHLFEDMFRKQLSATVFPRTKSGKNSKKSMLPPLTRRTKQELIQMVTQLQNELMKQKSSLCH